MIKIERTRQEFTKGLNGNFVKVWEEKEFIPEELYQDIVSNDTVQFFRNLGGKEQLTYGHTIAGRKVVKVVSTLGKRRIVRKFNFTHAD